MFSLVTAPDEPKSGGLTMQSKDADTIIGRRIADGCAPWRPASIGRIASSLGGGAPPGITATLRRPDSLLDQLGNPLSHMSACRNARELDATLPDSAHGPRAGVNRAEDAERADFAPATRAPPSDCISSRLLCPHDASRRLLSLSPGGSTFSVPPNNSCSIHTRR
jgi:hypothetical protein